MNALPREEALVVPPGCCEPFSAPWTFPSQGSLYPALYRLENKGWLKSAWKTTDGGRDAKYYSLTRSGRKRLDEERASWHRLCEAVSFVLNSAE
jgi:DNA-binding PadR family transcriptional regulator